MGCCTIIGILSGLLWIQHGDCCLFFCFDDVGCDEMMAHFGCGLKEPS